MRFHTTISHDNDLPAYGPNSSAVHPGCQYLAPPEADSETALGQPLASTRHRIPTIVAYQRTQDAFNAPLIRRPFHLRKLSDVSLLWRPTSENSLKTQELDGNPHASEVPHGTFEAPINIYITGEGVATHVAAVPDVRSLTLYSRVGNTTIPEWAFTIPELRLSIDPTKSMLLFDALRFAQLMKRGDKLVEIIKEIAFVEFVSYLDDSAAVADEEFQEAPRDFFAANFDNLSKRVAAERAALAAEVGSLCEESITLEHTQSAQDEELVEADASKLNKSSRCSRVANAFSRLSGRWRFQLRLLRERWREDRALKEVQSHFKRKIRVERKKLKLLEKEQELTRLRSEFLVAVHRSDQKDEDYKQAAHQRKLDAELAAQKRKLENLEYQYYAAKANSKVAAAMRHHEAKLKRICDTRQKAAKRRDVPKDSSQKTSHNSSKRSSLLVPKKLQSAATSVAPSAPKSAHSAVASTHQAPLLVSGCEENPWNSGAEAETRSVLSKEEPADVPSCPEPLSLLIEAASEEPPSEEPLPQEPLSEEPSLKEALPEEPSSEKPIAEELSSEEPPSEGPLPKEPSFEEDVPSEEPPSEPSKDSLPEETISMDSTSKDPPIEVSEDLISKESSPEEASPSPEEASPEEPFSKESSLKEPSVEEPPSEEPSPEEPHFEVPEPLPEEPSSNEVSPKEASLKGPEPSPKEASPKEPSPDDQPFRLSRDFLSKASKASPFEFSPSKGPGINATLKTLKAIAASDGVRGKKVPVRNGLSTKLPFLSVSPEVGTSKDAIKSARKKTPFWLTDEYVRKRKELAEKNEKPTFAPAQSEIDKFFQRSRWNKPQGP